MNEQTDSRAEASQNGETFTRFQTGWLTAHGFRRDPQTNHHRSYRHRSGNARVDVTDAEAACFTVYSLIDDRAQRERWRVQLTGAPFHVFTTTVKAALKG